MLTKAFDRVRLADVIECLREREVPEQIVRIIQELNTDTTARIRLNDRISKPIKLQNGVRQGDSLSPMLFNLIMDKIIANLPEELGYRMGNAPIHIICYADDAVLIADSEENLQTLLLRFDQTAERINLEISLSKTKSLTVSRNYTKCEVQLKGTPIEQVPDRTSPKIGTPFGDRPITGSSVPAVASYRPSWPGRQYLLRAPTSGLRGDWMGVHSHGEGNPSSGENPKQILALQAGGLS